MGDLVSGGQTRHYRLHVPKGYQPGGSLVFNFHGLGETTAEQELLSGTSRKADEAGFAVVYPEGRGSPVGWDAGPGPQGSADVDFVLALARKLESDLQVASHRIYATFADHPLER